MLSLDDPSWGALVHAYGEASDIPGLLRAAESLPPDEGAEAEPYFSLWSALCHQLDVYTASYAALPHLLRIIEINPNRFRWTVLGLAVAIEISRSAGRGPVVPVELNPAYQAAWQRMPSVAARLLERELNELELRVILAACACAKNCAALASAIMEQEPGLTEAQFKERYQT